MATKWYLRNSSASNAPSASESPEGIETTRSGALTTKDLSTTKGSSHTEITSLTTTAGDNLLQIFCSPALKGQTLAAIAGAKAAANALNKPLILGEVGYDPNDYGDDSDRRQFFEDVANAAVSEDLDGSLLWNWGRLPASSFTLAEGDTESDWILARWVYLLSLI